MRLSMIAGALFLSAACALAPWAPTAALAAQPKAPSSPITHVVIVIQQDRSFDDLFRGYPGANTSNSGVNCNRQTVPLSPVPLEAPYAISHTFEDARTDLVNGCFSGEKITRTGPGPIPQHPQYGFVPASETNPYVTIASQYVVADNMFPSTLNPEFEALQYLIAAQADSAVDNPNGDVWGCDAPPRVRVKTFGGKRIRPCFSYQTLGGELDAKNIAWRYYAPGPGQPGYMWSAYDAISNIRNGPDWKRSVACCSPSSKFITDVQNGVLAGVTWVASNDLATSDEAGFRGSSGPAWIASVVNAVGTSKFWNSTAIFVVWTGFGGWFDHVPPPQLDREGLGFRVPLLVVSPFAKRSYVSHVQFETGTILRFAEDVFGLARLAASDARANAPADAFDFKQAPRAFRPIPTR
jgi:phospholipase C